MIHPVVATPPSHPAQSAMQVHPARGRARAANPVTRRSVDSRDGCEIISARTASRSPRSGSGAPAPGEEALLVVADSTQGSETLGGQPDGGAEPTDQTGSDVRFDHQGGRQQARITRRYEPRSRRVKGPPTAQSGGRGATRAQVGSGSMEPEPMRPLVDPPFFGS